MSRIDDALRHVRGTASEQAPAGDAPQVFVPAWTVSRPDESGAPDKAANRSPAPVRQVGKAPPNQAPSGLISFSSAWREQLAAGPKADPALVEQFRRLAATLHHAHQANGLRSMMVTSASPGDGKTLTAVNLALVLAESYHYSVLLVDADLRRPSIPSVVDLGDGSGLSEALRTSTEQKLALVPVTSRLTLLPAGQPIANSIEALTSPRMRQILDEAVTRYDWVILDAPPVGPTADARLLTQMVGGTLFVIRAGQTQYPDVQKAVETIGREQILGVLLNGVKETSSNSYDYLEALPDTGRV